jgi:DNA-3-methyladenine glycosylase II
MIKIFLPHLFNQKLLFQYLRRSPNEITFWVKDGNIVDKLFDLNGQLLLTRLTFTDTEINVEFLNRQATKNEKNTIRDYINVWFDLGCALEEFYTLVESDTILKPIIKELNGLRMVKSPDLFEAISWSIIGQQINLPFAYSCKKALVENSGLQLNHEEKTYYTFPKPKEILKISDQEFRTMKFSGQKVKYMRGVAEEMLAGNLDLEGVNFEDAKKRLIAIKGIGNWRSNYVLMRCLGFKEAFPLEDVSLHNALKFQLNLEQKPSLQEIGAFAQNWKGWEAYATFYLWQTLLKRD